MKRFALLSVVAISVTACGGGGGGQAATAQAGDSFCKLAQGAKDDNDALSNIDPTDPAKVKVQLSGAIDSLSTLSAKLEDISRRRGRSCCRRTRSLLKANSPDFTGWRHPTRARFGDVRSPSPARPRQITSATSAVSQPTIPVDTTPGDTTPRTEPHRNLIDLGTGDDAINKFDFTGSAPGRRWRRRPCCIVSISAAGFRCDLNEAISSGPGARRQLGVGTGVHHLQCRHLSLLTFRPDRRHCCIRPAGGRLMVEECSDSLRISDKAGLRGPAYAVEATPVTWSLARHPRQCLGARRPRCLGDVAGCRLASADLSRPQCQRFGASRRRPFG